MPTSFESIEGDLKLIRLENSESYPEIHNRLENLFSEVRILSVDAAARPAVVESLAVAWRDLSKVEDLAVYLKGGLIQIFKMGLAEHDLDGRQLKLWERVQIGTDRAGEYLPPATHWGAFCTQHLNMARSTASHYARNFQVYYQQTPDFGVSEMVTAGTGKLKLARTYVEAHGLTDDVRKALVGDVVTCAHCGSTYDDVPLVCHCGHAFTPTRPATYAEVEMLVAAKKREPVVMVIKGTVVASEKDITVYASLRLAGEYIDLPAWEIPIGDGAIPAEMVDAVVKLLKRKLA